MGRGGVEVRTGSVHAFSLPFIFYPFVLVVFHHAVSGVAAGGYGTLVLPYVASGC